MIAASAPRVEVQFPTNARIPIKRNPYLRWDKGTANGIVAIFTTEVSRKV